MDPCSRTCSQRICTLLPHLLGASSTFLHDVYYNTHTTRNRECPGPIDVLGFFRLVLDNEFPPARTHGPRCIMPRRRRPGSQLGQCGVWRPVRPRQMHRQTTQQAGFHRPIAVQVDLDVAIHMRPLGIGQRGDIFRLDVSTSDLAIVGACTRRTSSARLCAAQPGILMHVHPVPRGISEVCNSSFPSQDRMDNLLRAHI